MHDTTLFWNSSHSILPNSLIELKLAPGDDIYIMNETDQTSNNSGMMGFQIKHEQAIREEDLSRLKSADDLVNLILGEMQYIGKLMGHRKIAPVEDIQQKIKSAYQRIDDYINRKGQDLDESVALSQEQGGPSGPELEKHPLLPELGGMNLEWDKINQEWMEALGVDSNMQDKAEQKNQVQNKLRNKIENALKLANKMQIKFKNKPGPKPVQKHVNQLVTKYKNTLDDLKNKPILRPEVKPEYVPKFIPPRPTPMGG